MRHIKLFEDLNKDGYEEVILNRAQFRGVKEEGVSINNSLSKNIANELTKDIESVSIETNILTDVISYTAFIDYRVLLKIAQISTHCIFIRTNNDGVASIYLLNDDWYYVDFYDYKSHTYYKCDQFYGLINCLNEIFKPVKQ